MARENLAFHFENEKKNTFNSYIKKKKLLHLGTLLRLVAAAGLLMARHFAIVVALVAKDCSIRLITNAKYYFMENNLFDESEHINISL